MLKNAFEQNQKKFICGAAACVLGLLAVILYLAAGRIAGFTEKYSVLLIILGIAGVLCNAFFLVKRMDTVEAFPFVAYVICVFLFLQVNANYLTAVVRQIDVTSVSGTFVCTIILFVLAAVSYAVSFIFVKDGE